MKPEGLVITGVSKDRVEFEINPPEYATRAPALVGYVHAYKGGYVCLNSNGQCHGVTIKELKEIIRRWEEIYKKK